MNSPASEWLPITHREMLIQGIINNGSWLNDLRPPLPDNELLDSIYDEPEHFQFTPNVKADLLVTRTTLNR